MQSTRVANGIANGHWESEESRAGWLVLLTRLGIAELGSLGVFVRAVRHARDAPQPAELVRGAPSGHAGAAP